MRYLGAIQKRDGEGSKKVILGFAFNSRGWGSSEDSMGKVLIIALYVTYDA